MQRVTRLFVVVAALLLWLTQGGQSLAASPGSYVWWSHAGNTERDAYINGSIGGLDNGYSAGYFDGLQDAAKLWYRRHRDAVALRETLFIRQTRPVPTFSRSTSYYELAVSKIYGKYPASRRYSAQVLLFDCLSDVPSKYCRFHF